MYDNEMVFEIPIRHVPAVKKDLNGKLRLPNSSYRGPMSSYSAPEYKAAYYYEEAMEKLALANYWTEVACTQENSTPQP